MQICVCPLSKLTDISCFHYLVTINRQYNVGYQRMFRPKKRDSFCSTWDDEHELLSQSDEISSESDVRKESDTFVTDQLYSLGAEGKRTHVAENYCFRHFSRYSNTSFAAQPATLKSKPLDIFFYTFFGFSDKKGTFSLIFATFNPV